METRISSFKPIVDSDSRILILGSVPGVRSLEMQEYYAHPQNAFWRILYSLFNENFSNNYPDKIEFIKRNKMAL